MVNEDNSAEASPKQKKGLAMWKRLHQDFAGEGKVVEHAGEEVLSEYSRCNDLPD